MRTPLIDLGILGLALLVATSCGAPGEEPAPEPQASAATATVLAPAPPLPGPTALRARFDSASVAVVGRVSKVSSAFALNEYGDRIILSQIDVAVERTLRGAPRERLTFELEGGRVGDVTLEVSDLPTLRVGERGIFAVRRAADDASWVPWGRGRGILRVPEAASAAALVDLLGRPR